MNKDFINIIIIFFFVREFIEREREKQKMCGWQIHDAGEAMGVDFNLCLNQFQTKPTIYMLHYCHTFKKCIFL